MYPVRISDTPCNALLTCAAIPPPSPGMISPVREPGFGASEALPADNGPAPGTLLADSEKGDAPDAKKEEPNSATGLKPLILMTSLLLCQFLVALDMVSAPCAFACVAALIR